MQETKLSIASSAAMQAFGEKLGRKMKGHSVIELIGDVGAGKTTLAKGIARGLGVEEDIASPSFTLNRTYQSPGGLALHHYDFYRLEDLGLMAHQLQESLDDAKGVTLIEWAKSAAKFLPEDRITIDIKVKDENSREVIVYSQDDIAEVLA